MYVFIDMEKSFYRFSMELFQRVMPAEMNYKWASHLITDRRLVEVKLGKFLFVKFDVFTDLLEGRRSEPTRDPSSYLSMCSGNGNGNGGSLSPTDYFCSGVNFFS